MDVRDSLDAVFEFQETHQERLGNDHFIEFETVTEHPLNSLGPDTDVVDRSVRDIVSEPTALIESFISQLRTLAEYYDEDEAGVIAKAVEQGLEEMSRTMVIEQYESGELTRNEVVEAFDHDALSDLD